MTLLRDASGPLDTATLARRLDLHPSGVRFQLRRLEGRGVVERAAARTGVGRPRDLWSLDARAIAEADRPEAGWAVARALARAVPASGARLRAVETAGAEVGRELAAELGRAADDDPVEALDHALEALGFEPRRTRHGRTARYRLMTCPYADVVRENPAVVCTLHKGIIRGVLAQVAPGADLTGFEPRDPARAGCVVEVTAVREGA